MRIVPGEFPLDVPLGFPCRRHLLAKRTVFVPEADDRRNEPDRHEGNDDQIKDGEWRDEALPTERLEAPLPDRRPPPDPADPGEPPAQTPEPAQSRHKPQPGGPPLAPPRRPAPDQQQE